MVSKMKRVLKKENSMNNDNITIDAKHNEMIEKFEKDKESIPTLKKELHKLVDEYKNSKNNSLKSKTEYIIQRNQLKEKIIELKNRINSIVNNKELNNYYLQVGSLLHNYYENIENYKKEEDINEEDEALEDDFFEYTPFQKKSLSKKKKNQSSVIDFFNSRERENTDPTEGNYTSMKISDFVKEEATFKKKNFLEDYLKKIDLSYTSKIRIDFKIYKCQQCQTEMTLYPSDGVQICNNCGIKNLF